MGSDTVGAFRLDAIEERILLGFVGLGGNFIKLYVVVVVLSRAKDVRVLVPLESYLETGVRQT